MSESPVMLFDEKCVFCNGAVNFALEREQQPLLRFATLQSEAGQELLLHHLPTRNFRTFVIIPRAGPTPASRPPFSSVT